MGCGKDLWRCVGDLQCLRMGFDGLQRYSVWIFRVYDQECHSQQSRHCSVLMSVISISSTTDHVHRTSEEACDPGTVCESGWMTGYSCLSKHLSLDEIKWCLQQECSSIEHALSYTLA